jgi:hypothetical protein
MMVALSVAVVGPSRAEEGCTAFRYETPTDNLLQPNSKYLAELWTVGRPDSSIYDDSPFALSPEGSKAALIVRRARPDVNSYCQRLLIVEIEGTREPIDLGDAGVPAMTEIDNLRGTVFPTGLFKQSPPAWSPDGDRIAYLRRVDGVDQVAVVAVADGSILAITRSLASVEHFRWSNDGKSLIIASRGDVAKKRRAIAKEALIGFHFDERFVPNSSPTPFPTGPNEVSIDRFDLDTSSSEALGDDDVRLDRSRPHSDNSSDIKYHAANPNGRSAWVSDDTPGRYPSNESLWIGNGSERQKCSFVACGSGIVGLWWNAAGDELRFFRKEGWGGSRLALYTWRVGQAEPERTLLTNDVVAGCRSWKNLLLCARESSLRPRYLALIDPATGSSRAIFEPNSGFENFAGVEVRRLHWKTKIGSEIYGDLVVPRHRSPSAKLPLIVVQYDTKGFLRGGTGDETPIVPLALKGFAVLSVQRPPAFAEQLGLQWASWEDAEAQNTKGWRDRRDTVDSIVRGVQAAISLGIIDNSRLAITGLSDGSSTAISALINTGLFSTAVLGSCCSDPHTFALLGGPAWTKALKRYGYPGFDQSAPGFWKEISLARNAHRLRASILMQLSDDEYQLALEAYAAIEGQGGAVDMFVFPGEHHIKWQPAHRLAVYNRTIAWLSFWLKNEIVPEAIEADIRNWKALRQRTENAP